MCSSKMEFSKMTSENGNESDRISENDYSSKKNDIRIVSTYGQFLNDEMTRLKKQNPGLTCKEIFKMAAANWKYVKKDEKLMDCNLTTKNNIRSLSPYNRFLKEEIFILRKQNPQLSHEEIFRMASTNWKKVKLNEKKEENLTSINVNSKNEFSKKEFSENEFSEKEFSENENGKRQKQSDLLTESGQKTKIPRVEKDEMSEPDYLRYVWNRLLEIERENSDITLSDAMKKVTLKLNDEH